MKPEVIKYRFIDNISESVEVLKVIAKSKFGDEWMGFLRETTWVHSEGYVTRKVEPIKGTPVKEFRKAIEKAGLVGKKIFEDTNSEDSKCQE